MWRRGRLVVWAAAAAGFLLAAGCGREPAAGRVDFPAGSVPRTEALVSPDWVRDALVYRDGDYRGQPPAGWRDYRLVVVEAEWVPPGKSAKFDVGHLPGAVWLNTEELESGYPEWRLRPLGDLQRVIGRLGVGPEATVVVYGRSLLAAARVWWILGYAGVKDVRLMDGGFEAWKRAGFPVETAVRTAEAVEFSAEPRADWLATAEEVRERLGRPGAWLSDVRSVEEYAGLASGYATLDARGRIPGAVHLGDADDAARLYGTRDGRLRPPEEVRALWRRQGLEVEEDGGLVEGEVVFYCGGGWRSSLAFFYAWLLGVEKPRNYSDGWSGWSTQYRRDTEAGGSTPGWRQQATGNPVAGREGASGREEETTGPRPPAAPASPPE